MRILACIGDPNLMQGLLGLGLRHLRKRIQHVGGLVHPAALMAGFQIDLVQCRPKAQGSVADSQQLLLAVPVDADDR